MGMVVEWGGEPDTFNNPPHDLGREVERLIAFPKETDRHRVQTLAEWDAGLAVVKHYAASESVTANLIQFA